ncbi:unnamed protein product [Cunninghamella echinulata]
MQALVQRYQSNILERPIRTFAIQSGSMQLLGNVVAQQFIEKNGKQHDIWRTGRMFIYGIFISGPVVGTWFSFVNRAVTIQNRFGAALARTAMDQILFTPVILGTFMLSMSLLERRSKDEIRQKFENSYINGLTNAYRFWPFANLFVFSMVPFVYRPLVNTTFSLGWNTYLSILNQNSLLQTTTTTKKNDTHVINHPSSTNLSSSTTTTNNTIIES